MPVSHLARGAAGIAVFAVLLCSGAEAWARAQTTAPAAETTAEPRGKAWGDLLRRDAEAIHQALRDHHPGSVDALNPGFKDLLARGHALARARAETADTRGHYWWALRQFVAGFDDGHTALSGTPALGGFDAVWPGFETAELNGRHVVVVRDDADAPPAGARLLSCDGIAADELARRNLATFRGLWFLPGQRAAFSGQLLRQAENPYLYRPRTCRFQSEAEVSAREYALNWRPYDEAAAARAAPQRARLPRGGGEPVGVRPIPGGWWIAASSFESDPAAPQAEALTRLVSELEAKSADLARGRTIVLDLRGNGGGSSHWGRAIANAVWGEAHVEAVLAARPDRHFVEWRVSDDNIAHLREVAARFDGVNPELKAWADAAVEGMTAAKAEGRALWRQPRAAPPADAAPPPPPSARAGRIFVVTDAGCGSACLDAADLWLALGAVHVGAETYADSQYMEIREIALPSGYGVLRVPMKVYRDRPRAPNATLKPVHVFEDDLGNTAALQSWILGLP